MNTVHTQQARTVRASGRLGQCRNAAARNFRVSVQARRPLFWLPGRASSDPGTATAMARRSRLEAVLFLAREPLSLRKLAQLANLTDGTEARTVLKSLQSGYDERLCAVQ